MEKSGSNAPGHPGDPPTWTSGAKSGVGTAIGGTSRIWFSLGHGVLEEVYYPRIDLACVRDCLLLVSDGSGFFSDERKDTDHETAYIEKGVPGYRLTNTCKRGRYRIEKEIVTDPAQSILFMNIRFIPLKESLENYHLYVVLSPHLQNYGYGNTGWIGEHKGIPMLFAERQSIALALGSSVAWKKRSVGFVGVSDGWHDVMQHKSMAWSYDRAENGNVTLTGEIDLTADNGSALLVIGFGDDFHQAGFGVKTGLFTGFATARREYAAGWRKWQEQLHTSDRTDHLDDGPKDLYRISTTIIRVHESKAVPGAIIASLAVPWGEDRGDEDLGGYHIVWVRDMVEAASGLLCTGITDVAERALRYLEATQDADGKWPQNMWLSGKPYWGSTQMDEAGLPILLLDRASREGLISDDDLGRYWPMVKKATGYILRYGPVTPEDRWEKDGGYSPFTLAIEIASLLAGAEIADRMKEPVAASYMRETADNWNENIERWLYVKDTDIDRKVGVEGHYMRIGTPRESKERQAISFSAAAGRVSKDAPSAGFSIGPAALALVRFGLRAADDPRIVNTIKVVDQFLKVETKFGPVWRRYPGDEYGEHEDGSAFDIINGSGIGRAWPLLTGERGHYEVAAGNIDEAKRLLAAMENFSNECGMLPEQVWDSPDIPEKELFCGQPTHSGMPLVWAHAEYVKLRRSIRDGHVYDTPFYTVQRYLKEKNNSPYLSWRFSNKLDRIPAGKSLRIEVLADAMVRWTMDNGKTSRDSDMRDTTLGVYIADIPGPLKAGEQISFTFYWKDARRWEGSDFTVTVGDSSDEIL